MRNDDADRFIQQNEDFARGLSAAERAAVDYYAEHHAGGLVVLLRHLDEEGWYVKAHDTWGDDGPCIVHIYNADADEEDPREQVLSFPDGSSALEAFLTVDVLPEPVQVEHVFPATKPTPTVGELVEVLRQFDQSLPVVGYVPGPVDWYVNIDGVRFDSTNPDIAVTIETRNDYDTRQF